MKGKRQFYLMAYAIFMFVFTLTGCSKETHDFDGITFSEVGGLYEKEFLLELSTNLKGGEIYYTLDGSDPTVESTKYSDKISIMDRTEDENLWSAITIENQGMGGFGGKMPEGFDGEMPEGLERQMPEDFDGQMPGGFDGQMPEGFDGQMPEGFDGQIPEGFDEEMPEGLERQMPEGLAGMMPRVGGGSDVPEENIFKGSVVKAAVFSESGELLTDIVTQSYFVSDDIYERYGELPIVSIVTDGENLFNDETGIIANYNETGSDWEREVSFTMYETDGTEAFSFDMGMRLNGGSSRSLTQKSFRFYTRAEYDEENTSVEYEIFDGLTTSTGEDDLTTFKRFILRNGGQDNSGTLIRDALMQTVVSDLNVDTLADQPCVAFINGEFWGIYTIRERYDNHYFANHYNMDKDEVAVLSIANTSTTPELDEGDDSDLAYYYEIYDFFNDNSMADKENYQKALEYIDIDNFIDYYIANLYSANTDWPANNNVFWRYKTANGGYDGSAEWYKDGRFRWALKDMDFGFGLMSDASANTLAHALNEKNNQQSRGMSGFTSESSTLFFRSLLENETFLKTFINRFCDVMNTNYDPETVIAALNEMAAEIEPAIEEHGSRFSSSVSDKESWEASLETVVEFVQTRTGYMQDILKEQFNLGEVVTVTLNNNSEVSYIRINDREINTTTKGVESTESWSGSYFADTTQTLTAVTQDNQKFVKFMVTDNASQSITEFTEETIEIILGNQGVTVEAVFE